MNIGIIIQARTSSTRLPSKIFKKLSKKEMLWHVVERCKKSKLANKIIIATSNDSSDKIIEHFCHKYNIDFFAGSLKNVLNRFYHCAKKNKIDIIVRVTSDCPLIDPFIIDESIKLYLKNKNKFDYISNCLHRTFPRGLDCEIFSFTALENAYHKATTLHEKEHVTPYIVSNNKTMPYKVTKLYTGDFRLTVDEEKDYQLLKHIYEKFYQNNQIIDIKKVIKYLKQNPSIAKINKNITQKHSIK